MFRLIKQNIYQFSIIPQWCSDISFGNVTVWYIMTKRSKQIKGTMLTFGYMFTFELQFAFLIS